MVRRGCLILRDMEGVKYQLVGSDILDYMMMFKKIGRRQAIKKIREDYFSDSLCNIVIVRTKIADWGSGKILLEQARKRYLMNP